jgi:hypothetical protein
LNAILGFSEVLKGELFGAHANPAYRDYCENRPEIPGFVVVCCLALNSVLQLVASGRGGFREASGAQKPPGKVSARHHWRGKEKRQWPRCI